MTDNEGFRHYWLKWFEAMFLEQRHYIPLGKSCPDHYDRMRYIIFKAWKNGDIPEFGVEPIMEQEVKQLDLFRFGQPDEVAVDQPPFPEGTLFVNDTPETKTDES